MTDELQDQFTDEEEFEFDEQYPVEEEEASLQPQPETQEWDPSWSDIDESIDAHAGQIFYQTMLMADSTPERLEANRFHEECLNEAAKARALGNEEKAREWTERAAYAVRDLLPVKSKLAEIAEKRASKNYEEQLIDDFRWSDSEWLKDRSPHPQRDVEMHLDAWNTVNAEREGYAYVVADGSGNHWIDDIGPDFAGGNIHKVPMKDWQYFKAHHGGDTNQRNLRRWLGGLGRLPGSRTLTNAEKEALRQEKNREKARQATADWIKERNKRERGRS